MADLDLARQSLTDALMKEKAGIEECNRQLAEIDAIRKRMIDHTHAVMKLEAALDVLNQSDPPRAKTQALPTLKTEFWVRLFGGPRKLSFAELYSLGIDKLGLDPNSEQAQTLRHRLGNALNALKKDGKVEVEGERGSQAYFLTPSALVWHAQIGASN